MKGLLQSKRFKKNLKKWLCMYVGALLLLTTVVTYSKYISKFNLDDEARTTKFNVVANYINNCDENQENCEYSCNGTEENGYNCTAPETSKFRPTEPISYDFTISSDLEVNTWLITYVYINADFKVLKFEDISSNTPITLYKAATETESEVINGATLESDNKIKFERHISVLDSDLNETKTYRITVKYNYNETTYPDNGTTIPEVIKVGFSAKQEK